MKKLPSFLLPAVAAGFATVLTAGMASADNVFVANNVNGTVTEIAPNGTLSTYVPSSSIPAGDQGATGLAFNSAGDLYVAYTTGSVVEYNPNGTFDATVATGLAGPRGITFDGSGDLFIADQGSGSITEVPLGNGTPETVVTSLSAPNDLTFDSAGNLYVTNGGGNSIDKISFSGTTVSSVAPFVTAGLSSPNGIVYDTVGSNAGNFFVVDHGTNSVKEFNSSGVPVLTVPSITNIVGMDSPKSIAIDSKGDFYITDLGATTVVSEYSPTGQLLNTYSNNAYISGSGSVKTLSTVPEPATYALLFAGLGVLFFVTRRKVARI